MPSNTMRETPGAGQPTNYREVLEATVNKLPNVSGSVKLNVEEVDTVLSTVAAKQELLRQAFDQNEEKFRELGIKTADELVERFSKMDLALRPKPAAMETLAAKENQSTLGWAWNGLWSGLDWVKNRAWDVVTFPYHHPWITITGVVIIALLLAFGSGQIASLWGEFAKKIPVPDTIEQATEVVKEGAKLVTPSELPTVPGLNATIPEAAKKLLSPEVLGSTRPLPSPEQFIPE